MKKILMLIVLLGLVTACAPQVYTGASTAEAPSQLIVQADATVQALPDRLKMRLGVVTEAPEAGEALSDNNQRMENLMLMLREIGLQQDDLATGQFQIRPEWSIPPRPTPANWQRKIVAYRVSNELLVETGRVDLAGDLLGLAQESGANQIGGLQFDLADPELHRLQAITAATQKAQRKAQALASAAGARLGEIISLSLDSSGNGFSPKLMMAEARTTTADAVPVAAGKVEVHAGVNIVYRLLNPSRVGP